MTCSKINIDEIAALLTTAGPAPDRRISNIDRIEAERLLALAELPDAVLLLHHDDDRLTGLALVHLLPWDTDYFGFPCARIDTLMAGGDNDRRFNASSILIKRIIDWAADRNVRFLSVKLSGPDPIICQALESFDFYLVDTGVRLTRHPQRLDSQTLPAGWSYLDRADDPAAVASTFKHLFYDGRFHNDPRVPLEQADRLWESAINNQLRIEAQHILLLMENDIPRGLTAIRPLPIADQRQKPVGSVFIVGVVKEYRGRGWGKQLLNETLTRYQNHYQSLILETSTYNEPALRLYRSLGFIPGRFTAGLHRWTP